MSCLASVLAFLGSSSWSLPRLIPQVLLGSSLAHPPGPYLAHPPGPSLAQPPRSLSAVLYFYCPCCSLGTSLVQSHICMIPKGWECNFRGGLPLVSLSCRSTGSIDIQLSPSSRIDILDIRIKKIESLMRSFYAAGHSRMCEPT